MTCIKLTLEEALHPNTLELGKYDLVLLPYEFRTKLSTTLWCIYKSLKNVSYYQIFI